MRGIFTVDTQEFLYETSGNPALPPCYSISDPHRLEQYLLGRLLDDFI